MGKIFRLADSASAPTKRGLKRAGHRRRIGSDEDQLGLFSAVSTGKIVSLPSRLSPFEEALLLDERGSDKAEEAYRIAVDVGDCVDDAFCNLGIVLYHAGDVQGAFSSFTNTLKVNPIHFEAHYNLGNLYLDDEDLQAARVHYELAEAVDSTYENLHFNAGIVYALQGDMEHALRAFGTYRRLAPDELGRQIDDLLHRLRRVVAAN